MSIMNKRTRKNKFTQIAKRFRRQLLKTKQEIWIVTTTNRQFDNDLRANRCFDSCYHRAFTNEKNKNGTEQMQMTVGFDRIRNERKQNRNTYRICGALNDAIAARMPSTTNQLPFSVLFADVLCEQERDIMSWLCVGCIFEQTFANKYIHDDDSRVCLQYVTRRL